MSEVPPPTTLRGRLRARLARSPKLLPDLFWAVANSVLAVVASLVIFRIVSRLVPTERYGEATLVLGIVALLNQLLVGPRVLAQLRLYVGHRGGAAGAGYVAAMRALLLRTSALLAAAYLAFALLQLALDRPTYWRLAPAAVVLLALQTQLGGALAVLEAERRYRSLTLAQALHKLLQVPLLLALLYAAVGGASAIVLAQAAAVAVVLAIWGRPGVGRAADAPAPSAAELAAGEQRSFGWWLYLLTFSSWVLTTSDRYLVEAFGTAADAGVYVANYGLWAIPYLTLNTALELLIRTRVFERAEAGDWAGVGRIVRGRQLVALGLGLAGTGLVLLVGERVSLAIVGEAYWYGPELMLLVCVAHLFYVVGISPYVVFVSSKRTRPMAVVMAAVAVLNVGCNLALVPVLGLVGAAWSTLVAFAAMAVLLAVAGHRVLAELRRDQRTAASSTART
jgi:O-antigen/teichoic acid export membrane protein